MSQFENAAEYVVDSENMDKFVTCLVETGHFLVYTGAFEEDRIYIIASPSLYGREEAIQTLIQSCFAYDKSSQPSTPLVPGGSNVVNGDQFEDYILIFSPWQNIIWTGEVVEIPTRFIHLGIKTRRVRLTTGDSTKLVSAKANFWTAVQHSGIEIIQEHRAHIPRINKELYKIKMTVFKLADSTISSVSMIREQTMGLGCQELVEECFSFASDFGIRAAKFLELAVRLQLDLKLVRLAIDWICFITDDCIPSDRKTFRWAVAALEFVHMMTRGANILALNENEFATLQSKVARCVALLISHFDVLGTRYVYELQVKQDQQRRRNITAKRTSYLIPRSSDRDNITTSSTFGATNDAAVTGGSGAISRRENWMRQINELETKRTSVEQERKIIGKILDDQKPEDQSLVFLAPSSSNISFSWQQGRFIGSGTFGSVYLAINLDTSTVMAVKEIRFPDSSSLSALHKSIKEEMKVMEMLHHRNIVQYFGMVRDREMFIYGIIGIGVLTFYSMCI
jgi:mitogen-activated protein kinase kinase kinase